MSVTTYSTQEVAKLLGIHKSTLLRWLYSARIAEPKHATIAMQNHRVWSERDLKRVEKFKEASYRKKPRRKKAGSARVKRSNRRLSCLSGKLKRVGLHSFPKQAEPMV